MKEHHSKQPADPTPQMLNSEEEKQEPAVSEAPTDQKQPSEIEKLNDRILRLQADYDNFRKRTLRDQNEMASRANADLLLQLLPVMDHFERGLRDARAHKANKSIVDGFQLIYDQLLGVLLKVGLTPINAEGQMFDPNYHEAITNVPSDEHPADTVVTETRRGYLLAGKLLRASQVIVSSGPAASPTPSAETTQPSDSGEKGP